MSTITVNVSQISPATSEATIRQHHVLIDRPEAKGGEDRGAMGGELLLASLGGCFMSNLLAAIRAREADVRQIEVEIRGELGENPSRFHTVEMRIAAEYSDADLMQKLVTIAERGCIVFNTLKPAVALSWTIHQRNTV